MKFIETEFPDNLEEIKQSLDMKFAWVSRVGNKTYTNNMPFVKCRDFLGDTLWAEQSGKKQSIYGFSFDPQEQKINKNKTLLVIKFPTIESKAIFIVQFSRLHYKEYQAGVKLSSLKDTGGLFVVVEGSSIWRKSVVGISLYTFMLKCLGYRHPANKELFESVKTIKVEQKEWDDSVNLVSVLEANYLQDINTVKTVLDNIKKLTNKLPVVHGLVGETNINKIHNHTGFSTVCTYFTGVVGERLKKLLNDKK